MFVRLPPVSIPCCQIPSFSIQRLDGHFAVVKTSRNDSLNLIPFDCGEVVEDDGPFLGEP